MQNLNAFTRAYIHAACFTEDPHPGQGEYPEPDLTELDPAFIERARVDCEKFQAEQAALIAEDEEKAGRDFWLTRNGHGAGFWDGDWPEPAASILTDASKAFGAAYDGPFAEETE